MLRGVELIIYDLDGVIVDSAEAICIAFNSALEGVGAQPRPEDELKGMIGIALAEMFRMVLPSEKHLLIGRCFERYLETFAEASPRHTRILDGVEETLLHFKERGLSQSLATNKSTLEAERMLRDLGIRPLFDLVIGSNLVSSPKPSPDMILLSLEKMGVEPVDTVLVEDSPTGLATARAAGVHSVAITTGTHASDVLASLCPEYLIEDIRELNKIVFTG